MRLTLASRAGASPTVEAVTAAYQRATCLRRAVGHGPPPGEAFQKPITASGEPEILGLDRSNAAARS
jgi:hypothetical protein